MTNSMCGREHSWKNVNEMACPGGLHGEICTVVLGGVWVTWHLLSDQIGCLAIFLQMKVP